MSEKYTIAIEVTGKDAGASSVLDNVGGSLKRVGEFVVGGLIVGGLQKIGNAFLGLGRNAIQSVGNVQMLEKQIGSLLAQNLMYERQADGTFEKVMDFGQATQIAAAQTEDMLGFVQKLAIASSFGTADVEEVTKIAITAGMATDEVKQFTAAFMDVAAMKGITNLQFAASQFFQLKQAGALTINDLRQLSRIGIDVSRIISTNLSGSLEEAEKRFGTLSPAARKVFGGMELDIKEFNKLAAESPEVLDAIYQKFILLGEEGAAGAAAEIALTVNGMMTSIGEIVELGSRNLFRPIFEAIAPPMAEALKKVQNFVTSDKIVDIGEKIGASISNGITFVKRFVNLLQAGGDPITAFRVAISGLIPPDIEAKINRFLNPFTTFFRALEAGNTPLSALKIALSDFLPDGMVDIIMGIATAFEKLFDAYSLLAEGDLEGFFAGIENAWAALLPTIGNIFSKLWEFVQPYLAELWTNFSNWFMSQNWGEIIGTIWNGFVGIFAKIWEIVSPELETFFINVWTWFSEQDWVAIITSIIDWFVDFGTQLWDTAVSPSLDTFYTNVSTWFSEQDWGTMIIGIAAAYVNFGLELWTTALTSLGTFYTNVSTWFGEQDWIAIGGVITAKIVEGLATFAVDAATAFEEWGTSVSTWVDTIDWYTIGYNIVTKIIDGLALFNTLVLAPLGEWFTNMQTILAGHTWSEISALVITKIILGLGEFGSKVGTTLAEWYNATKTNLSGMNWASIGTDIVNGIINGITSMANAVWTALSGIVRGAIDGVRKETLDANSPSRVTASLLGKPMAQGVEMGWLDEMERLNSLMSTALTGTIQNQSNITNNENRFNLAVNVNSVNEAQQIMDNFAFRRAWAG